MTITRDVEQYIQKIKVLGNHNDQIIKVLEGFLKFFPVLDAEIFRYSPLGFLTEGIMAIYPKEGLSQIRHIRDDIRNVPEAYKAVRTRESTMVTGENLVKHSLRYTLSPHTRFIIFVPICFRSNVVGVLASTQFSVSKEKIERLLPSFTYYGKLVGEIFEQPYLESDESYLLNNREVEVMQLLSLGESTKTIAELLHLSEFTVQDYIKSALKKIGVNNRTYAVAKLIRQGIIS